MTKSMSSGDQGDFYYSTFQARFAEACGSEEPARIQRLLNISYQAAKNYLNGRLPDARVLITIAERTPYSIHWLLTGKGSKFQSSESPADTLPLARQLSELIRQEALKAVDEHLARREEPANTIVLRAADLKTEKTRELPVTRSNGD